MRKTFCPSCGANREYQTKCCDRVQELEKQIVSLEANPPFQDVAEKLAKEKAALITEGNYMSNVLKGMGWYDDYPSRLIRWENAKRSCK